jgi:hypothetical protein
MWKKRDKHLERARHHAAFGNAAAANAHIQRADQLLFGVSGQSASERLRAREERARIFPQAQATLNPNVLLSDDFFHGMASEMLDAVRIYGGQSEVSMLVQHQYDAARTQLAGALRRALGAWEATPRFIMAGDDRFDVVAEEGKEKPLVVLLSVHPARHELVISVAPPAFSIAREFPGNKHVRDDEHDEHAPGARRRYDGDAMES